jgi:hypothetical protein
VEALNSPEVAAKLRGLGGNAPSTPEAMRTLVASEIGAGVRVIEKAGLKPAQ